MFKAIPNIGEPLIQEHLDFLRVLAKSCRNAIVAMTTSAQSGHPGGSCSCIDYLALLYAFIISQTGEDLIVSNGHISPAVYAILAEMGYIPRQEVIDGFRKIGKIYEGHITRHVKGILYGTGPLGIGVSAATGFALAKKLQKSGHRVFAIAGDGECEEGQVYEMMHFADKYKLSNLTLFVDWNNVQLSGALKDIMPIDLPKIFLSARWNVIETDGHDFASIWQAIGKSYTSNSPTVILGRTIMGKGVSFMESDGAALKSTWHGIPPKPEQAALELAGPLKMAEKETALLDSFRKTVKWRPPKPNYPAQLSKLKNIKTGKLNIISAGAKADCRSAYGKALCDLAALNSEIIALTADLGGSVKTDIMAKDFQERAFDVGIAEQHMVSLAGGISLAGFIPFCSTFGAFMTSRARDQARINDINETNVKMVATHCGLSVGEDGPTHQAIDDMASFSGLLNTHILEPADANQTDHIIRYIASHYGNFYVRMGRHKFPVILREDGTLFYDEEYQFEYGKADRIRKGDKLTVIASGSMVAVATEVADKLKNQVSIDLFAVSSVKNIDPGIISSLKKTGKLITVEDHGQIGGLAAQVNNSAAKNGLSLQIQNLAVPSYQLSGDVYELYETAGIGAKAIEESCLIMSKK